MGGEWLEKKLGDVCEIRRGSSPRPIVDFMSLTKGMPWVKIADATENNSRNINKTKEFIHQDGVCKSVIVEKGDLILSNSGTAGLPKFMGITACIHDGWQVLRNLNGITNDYLYYTLIYIRSALLHNANDSTMKNLTLDMVRDTKVNLPPIDEQKAIAHILGSLDDKIELNRQTNQTLGAMAQALFKSWFVDFDPVIDNALAAGNEIPDTFQDRAAARKALGDKRKALPEDVRGLLPSSFVHSEELGWIPEGWEVKPLANIIEIIGGGTPKTSIKEYWNGDIPWFSVVDSPNSSDIFVINTEKHITSIAVRNSSTKLLNKGTTIISARGTVGKCAMVGNPMAMNQSCYGIHGKKNISDTYIYYSVLVSVSDLQRKSHGSVFGTITRDTFKLIQIPFCGETLTQTFDNYVKFSFEKILLNCHENISLTKLRDTLLPKLISGELRIPDAEKLVEALK